MTARIVGGLFTLAVASVANAGAIVELVPDQPGPYTGGESLGVDVWVTSDVEFDVLLKLIQFDFSQSDPTLSLDPVFTFDFSSIPDDSGYQFRFPELPVPWTANLLDCICPGLFLRLPGEGSLHIGSIGVQLPTDPGDYYIDTLNSNEPDEAFGARLVVFWPLLPSIPPETWRSFNGDITGGGYNFMVVPEPGSLSLVLLGGLAIVLWPRRLIRGSVVAGPLRRCCLPWASCSRCRATGAHTR